MKPRTTGQRGYGWAHQRERAKWQRVIDSGGVSCWRCGRPIHPGMPWDLGHDDNDRSVYRGPECRPCNRATTGRRKRPPAPPIRPERRW